MEQERGRLNARLAALLEQYAQSRDYGPLAAGLEAMIHNGEGFFLVYMQLGNAYLALNDYQRARKALEKAAALDPEEYLAKYELAGAIAGCGDDEAALAMYRQAAQVDPSRSEPVANAGSCCLRLGRDQEALGLYQQALAINRKDQVAREGVQQARKLIAMSPAERAVTKVISGVLRTARHDAP
jgi:Tfp pilus assembly protein PilF